MVSGMVAGMGPADRPSTPVLTVVAVAVLLFAVAWTGPPRGDLANYVVAASLWLDGTGLDQAYDYGWFGAQARAQGFANPVGFAVLPPHSAWLGLPLAGLEPGAAALAFWVVQAGLLVALALTLAKCARAPGWAGVLAVFAVWPAVQSQLVQGQMHLPAAVLVALGFLAWRADRDVAAGVAWGLAVVFKVHAWPLVLAVLVAGRWRIAVTAIGTALVVLLPSVALLGVAPYTTYITEIAPASARGWFTDPFAVTVQTIGVTTRRLFVEHALNPEPLWQAPWVARAVTAAAPAAVVGLLLPRTRRGDVVSLAAIGLAVLATGPLLARYHLLAALPYVMWLPGRARLGALAALGFAAWVPVSAHWPGPVGALVAMPRLWAMLALAGLAIALTRPGRWGAGLATMGAVAAGGVAGLSTPEPTDVDGAAPVEVEVGLISASLRVEQGQLVVDTLDRGGWRSVPLGVAVGQATRTSARDGDLWLAEQQLTTHGAHDSDGVVDDAGRVWFLSDRGAGVRCLRPWVIDP
jgi:hypothetical protein